MLVCLFVYFFLYSSIRKILHPVIPDLMSVFLNKRRRNTGHNPHEHIFNIFESLSYWSTQLFFCLFVLVLFHMSCRKASIIYIVSVTWVLNMFYFSAVKLGLHSTNTTKYTGAKPAVSAMKKSRCVV